MTTQTKRMQPVYKLGEGYAITVEGKPLYSIPYTIHYVPESQPDCFYLAYGDSRNGNGTFLRPAQLLEPTWRMDFERTGAEWLIPLLEQMAQGESVTSTRILALYQQRYGTPPEQTAWPV